MVVWYNTEKMAKWFEPNEMRYDFYQAEHPWGPWTAIDSHSDRFLSRGHMYGPSLCAKFQHRSGTDVNMVLFTSGCPFEDEPSGLYKAWTIPVILKTGLPTPSNIVKNDDVRIAYSGKWESSSEGRQAGPVHETASANASAELTFMGTGIDYIADKNRGFGSISVYIDGAFAQDISLALEDFPRLCGVVVFRARGLKEGIHTVRIVNKTAAPVAVDAFQVYGGSA
jgi:hypothetical protein